MVDFIDIENPIPITSSIGRGLTYLPERGRAWSIDDRNRTMVNVLDFNGIDPAGNSSSTAAIQAAINEWRSFSGSLEPVTACLYFPPNMVDGGEYVIDGDGLDFTSIRGNMNPVYAVGASLKATGSGLRAIDTMNSLNIQWWGGRLNGDPSDPPESGLQLGRMLAGSSNTSSHQHMFIGLTITGEWTRAAMYNFGSEANWFARCNFFNKINSTAAYAVIQDGQSGVFTPQSNFVTAGIGDPTGFANNLFTRCILWHVADNGTDGGPALFVSRAENHKFEGTLTQVRGDSPTVTVHHVTGDRGIFRFYMEGRFETSASQRSLIYFTGDDQGTHRDIKIETDRLFAQRLFEADPTFTDAVGVTLKNVDVSISNVYPGAATSNINGYAEAFANRAKFGKTSGRIAIANRSPAETTFVDIRGFDVPFDGELIVADRAQIGTLPTGNFTISDETDVPPDVYRVSTPYTVTFEDASSNVSPTTVEARVWRDGSLMKMVFTASGAIDITGMTAGSQMRINMPDGPANTGVYSWGYVVMSGLVTPLVAGEQLDLFLSGNARANVRKSSTNTVGTTILPVSEFNGAIVRKFYVEWEPTP